MKPHRILTLMVLAAMLACADSGLGHAEPAAESPHDLYVEPLSNMKLVNEVLLFELHSRIDQAVSGKFGAVQSASYEVDGIRADGHGGYSVKIHGRIAHGSVMDEVDIYLDSPYFDSGLAVSRIEILHGNEAKRR
ncbi:hypothetical protein GZH47_09110 [Paenibacillus rhizovicinus]|uniref:DUF3888 domain-containing protein n=1 Tax=Paenibacillus rhizovicinus TaxID=2704463 RepID=A0A6C0NXM3_9BACL|nr:hypothetical protein [Paenibacillus rhizovicinus]QHW30994.1 hypothetical protein GZH47_09110 [Paenibacillus rhizovicinus]